MIILGIDPGIAKVGYALIEKTQGKTRFIKCGLISTASELPKLERFKEIKLALTKLILEYQPEIVALEKILFFKNKKTVIEVAQAIGLIISLIGDHGIELLEFTPLEVKMVVTGYGRADKLSIKKMVNFYFKVEQNFDDDVYDAIAIAITAINLKK